MTSSTAIIDTDDGSSTPSVGKGVCGRGETVGSIGSVGKGVCGGYVGKGVCGRGVCGGYVVGSCVT